jgi:hypothetical protein
MRPAARVGRQHQSDDFDQAHASGEQRAAEEAELSHTEQQQGESSDPHQHGQQALAIEAREMLRVTVTDGRQIDRATARHQRLSSLPISWWRTLEVSMSMIATVTRMSSRMADTSE